MCKKYTKFVFHCLLMKKYIITIGVILIAVFVHAQDTWQVDIINNNVVKVVYNKVPDNFKEQVSLFDEQKIRKKNSAVKVEKETDKVVILNGEISLNITAFSDSIYRGFNIGLHNGESLYGGGERSTALDKRGQYLPLYNRAHYAYELDANQLNFGIPVLFSNRGYGVFFNNPSKGFMDIGAETKDLLKAGFVSGRLELYLFFGKSIAEQLNHYTALTGRQNLPPRWAFGNIQSRFGYRSQKQAEEVVAEMQKQQMPVDALVLDLFWFGDSVQGFLGNLDWDRRHWPTAEKMVADFKKKNVKTILITEPFFVERTKYYEESKPFLAKDSSGKPYYLKEFYFGKGGLIDLFRPDSRQYFWRFYKKFTDQGIAGWWGDLGEPENHPQDLVHDLSSIGIHRKVFADEVHNYYGHVWSKLVHDGFAKHYPEKRLFHLNRAGFAGSQQYSAFPWTGDVARSWGGLKAQLPNLLSMSISGMPYIHSDAGGFALGDSVDSELYTRWLQFAVFTPVFRPHGSALQGLDPTMKDIPSEPIYYNEPYKSVVRNAINLRYRLLPYNYNLAYDQALDGKPLMRPMFYDNFSDEIALKYSNQYFWGAQMIVSPVIERNTQEQNVYLPIRNEWYDLYTNRLYKGGEIKVSAGLENIPVFVKGGSFLPTWERESYTTTEVFDTTSFVTVTYYPGSEPSKYHLRNDADNSIVTIKNKKYTQLKFEAKPIENGYAFKVTEESSLLKNKKRIIFRVALNSSVISLNGNKVKRILVNNKSVKFKVTTSFVEVQLPGNNADIKVVSSK